MKLSRPLIIHLLLISCSLFFLVPAHGSSKEETSYQSAREAYYALKKSAEKRKFRHNWMKVIDKYRRVQKSYPKGQRGDESLFMAAKLFVELSPYSGKREDLESSNNILEKLVNQYPESSLADDAAFMMGENYEKLDDDENAYHAYAMILEKFSKGDMASQARKRAIALKPKVASKKASPEKEEATVAKPKEIKKAPAVKKRTKKGLSKYAHVTDIRHWSNPNYTRIVIDLDGQAKYKHHLLKKDPSIKKPPRLYIDILGSKKLRSLNEEVPIHDGLLKRARVGQNDVDKVRVVLDIESIRDYKIFPMLEPFRIIIDVWGEEKIGPPAIEALIPGEKKNRKGLQAAIEDEEISLSQQLGLGVRKIVIDPGHGGKDPGAVGPRGTKEKDINLAIAKRLKKKLEKNFNYRVVLTRSDDRYLDLPARTAIANAENADLFISIHTNANRNRRAYGIETYVMNLKASDRYAAEVAARENAGNINTLGDYGDTLSDIFADMMKTNKVNESSRLASSIQGNMAKYMAKRYDRIKNLGVKRAPFWVLIGANMPSILVEVGFISNRTEEKRLRNAKYVDNMSNAIALGVDRYARLIKKASVVTTPELDRVSMKKEGSGSARRN